MNKFWNPLVIALFSLFSLIACRHDAFTPDVETILTTDSILVFGPPKGECDPDSVYFEKDILPLISSRCATCHRPGGQYDRILLTDYEEIMRYGEVRAGNPNDSELFEVISDSDPDKRMPPPPDVALTADEIALIRKWIEQGALNNTCDFETQPDTNDCAPAGVSFASEITNILSSNGCTGCHSGGSIVLSSYSGVKAVVDDGKLLGSIKHEAGFRAMPDGGGKMNDCDIQTIETWINEGALNN